MQANRLFFCIMNKLSSLVFYLTLIFSYQNSPTKSDPGISLSCGNGNGGSVKAQWGLHPGALSNLKGIASQLSG